LPDNRELDRAAVAKFVQVASRPGGRYCPITPVIREHLGFRNRGRCGRTRDDPAAAAEVIDTLAAVEAAARAARGTVADLAVVPDGRLDDALRAMAERLAARAAEVLEANTPDMHAARGDGVRDALLDRLRLDDARLGAMAGQLRALADVPAEPSRRTIRDLPGGLRLAECRRPVGVIGANFEARPNVVIDIASQFVKSRNVGVLRTGSAAIRSAIALADEVMAPALGQAGLDPR
jgi:glutamate-5-semialdehyde dehydrogenase